MLHHKIIGPGDGTPKQSIMVTIASLTNILKVLAISSLVALPILSANLSRSHVHALGESATLVQSGLVMTDSLKSGDFSAWTFAGDASHEHAPYSFSEDGLGLHISVKAINPAQWAGFFAKSANTNARAFHALISLPYATISSNNFNTGLYVQTASRVNYVACVAHVTTAGYYWAVLYAEGSMETAQKFHRLFVQHGGPLVRDCTIVTDGQSSLTVYLDGQKVYSNSSMNLQMPAPFNAYLEVETTCTAEVLTGTYSDFYEVATDAVTVQDVPTGYTAQIFDSGTAGVIASGVAGRDGIVSLNVGSQKMPIDGILQLQGTDGNSIGITDRVKIWGGDVYRLNVAQQTKSTTTAATTTSSSASTASGIYGDMLTAVYHTAAAEVTSTTTTTTTITTSATTTTTTLVANTTSDLTTSTTTVATSSSSSFIAQETKEADGPSPSGSPGVGPIVSPDPAPRASAGGGKGIPWNPGTPLLIAVVALALGTFLSTRLLPRT
jgi:hypothetical protein